MCITIDKCSWSGRIFGTISHTIISFLFFGQVLSSVHLLKHFVWKLFGINRISNELVPICLIYAGFGINCCWWCRCPKFLNSDDSRSPTMCLVCGCIVCSQSYCCQTLLDDVHVGAATAHAAACGAGMGIFIRFFFIWAHPYSTHSPKGVVGFRRFCVRGGVSSRRNAHIMYLFIYSLNRN